MLNLELLQPLPQPNWDLTPFLDQPPTIADYKKDKAQYQSEVIENGVYRITTNMNAIHAWGDDLILWNHPDVWAWRAGQKQGSMPWPRDAKMKVHISNWIWIEALRRGTITMNNGVWELLGVFEKNGSVIHFNTLHEETMNYV